MTCGIYKLTSPSGNFYIGSSKDISARWREHRRQLRLREHCNRALQRAFDKHGPFVEEVLMVCAPEHLIMYEQACIDGLSPLYNNSKVAGRVDFNDEVRSKIKAKATGRTHAPDTIARLIAAKSSVSAETRAKMSAAKQGRTLSPETRAKMSAAKKGKSLPPEVRMNMSKARLALPAEVRATTLGRAHTPETKAKMSAATKARYARRQLDQGAVR